MVEAVAVVVVIVVTASVPGGIIGIGCLLDGVEWNVEGGEDGDDDGDSWRELFTNLLTYSRTTLHPPLRLRFLGWMNALCQYLVVQMKTSVHCR